MTAAQKQLLFNDVDGLAFAAARGKLDESKLPATYMPQCLGPLLELLHLSAGGRMPRPGNRLAPNGAAPMIAALDQGRESWIVPLDQYAGFIRAIRRGPDGDNRLTGFLMKAKRAGQDVSGLPAAVSGQLVAAMEELENNIHEHADAPETGMLAYRAEPAAFEFVVADRASASCAACGAVRPTPHCRTKARRSKRRLRTASRATVPTAITATASGRSSRD